ncbi:uncharacterized protein Z518_02806 [Rhinocladiella mackenziei CBS 650.93]|uniref:Uncharacterized protein n=1 Tax=Rhinocladiella mackenziei CBS 650.93 TaxID=1442369 RepID=A0A0D2JFR7_9EURO|nr:uncharacterized protein Z518_02806 [Rhinocladiella mackenziei CBS 650.93]KIX08150.1 hypothetical protein Z518_02806 [Rhinocladiella mackenziei CBS 650.93]
MGAPAKGRGSAWTPRTVTAPIAAVIMAGLLYTYSVTSIRAAKRNAKLHREADGGQLDMRRESLRRHGLLEPVEGTDGIALFRDARAEVKQESEAKPLGADQRKEARKPRTRNENILDGYRGRGGLEKFKEDRSQ